MEDTKTIEQFIEDNNLSMRVRETFDNPDMDNDRPETMDHFSILIEKPGNKAFHLFYSQGLGLRKANFRSGYTQSDLSRMKYPSDVRRVSKVVCPKLADVLDCLASDASTVENCLSFDDFASEMGYDEDSRKAEKTFNKINEQVERLKTLLGEDAINELMYQVERL